MRSAFQPLIVCLSSFAMAALGCAESNTPSLGETDSDTEREEDAAVECVLADQYQGTATALGGDCGELIGTISVSFGGGVLTNHEVRFDSEIVTMIVAKGCTVRVTRDVSVAGMLMERLHAESLALQADGSLKGEALLSRFEADAVVCEGTYRITLDPAGE